MKRVYIVFILFCLISIIDTIPLSSKTIFVKANATGLNLGTSWTNAFKLFQSALDKSNSGDQIWVTAGTYYPTKKFGGTDERNRTFQMKNGVSIYGGFIGNETLLTSRDYKSYETKLSGDIGISGDISDNCYHLFYHNGTNLDSTAILDGFTVTGGNANGTDQHGLGGAMNNFIENSPTISNCIFSNNSAGTGGAMNIYYLSNPTIKNCIFSNNSVTSGGGALWIQYSSPQIINCLFYQNSANIGGAIANYDNCSPIITNSTFTENLTNSEGGALFIQSNSSLTINNSIIWNNTANSSGNEIYTMWGGTTTLNYTCYSNKDNDIVNNGSTFIVDSFCITLDPLFIDPTVTDYRITLLSPCTDTGNDSYNNESTDVRGKGYPRKLNKKNEQFGTIDIGAFEFKYDFDNTKYDLFLNQGWNMISSYYLPNEPADMDSIFNLIIDKVIIVKNNNGEAFIPQYGINDIGSWNITDGYQIYMTDATILGIFGSEVDYSVTPIILTQGWNMIAYLRNSELDCETAFAGLLEGNLVIVKDNEGNVFIPEYGINTLGNLMPGNGYQIYVINKDMLIYPNN